MAHSISSYHRLLAEHCGAPPNQFKRSSNPNVKLHSSSRPLSTSTTPNTHSGKNQDGELVVVADGVLEALTFDALRVLTLPATTSRRGTEQPQRARIRTSSSSSKCVSFFSIKSPSDTFLQLYRFLARRTDSNFNKVYICAYSRNTHN